jgi:hypothetical protein
VPFHRPKHFPPLPVAVIELGLFTTTSVRFAICINRNFGHDRIEFPAGKVAETLGEKPPQIFEIMKHF